MDPKEEEEEEEEEPWHKVQVSYQLHGLANLLSMKKAPGTHSMGDMIGLTAGPDAFMKINGFWTCQELNHDSYDVQSVA
jgi:hypothetical protein